MPGTSMSQVIRISWFESIDFRGSSWRYTDAVCRDRRYTFSWFHLTQTPGLEAVWNQEDCEPLCGTWVAGTGDHCALVKYSGSSLRGMWCPDTVVESPQPPPSVCSTASGFLGRWNFRGCVLLQSPVNSSMLDDCWEKEHTTSMLIWSVGENTWWDEGDSYLILILPQILYGPQFP